LPETLLISKNAALVGLGLVSSNALSISLLQGYTHIKLMDLAILLTHKPDLGPEEVGFALLNLLSSKHKGRGSASGTDCSSAPRAAGASYLTPELQQHSFASHKRHAAVIQAEVVRAKPEYFGSDFHQVTFPGSAASSVRQASTDPQAAQGSSAKGGEGAQGAHMPS